MNETQEKAITNPFEVGQTVVCISEDFPWIQKYGGVNPATITPKLHEQLTVNEILGDFVRFDKYDTDASYNWWYWNRFAPISEVCASAEINEEYRYMETNTPAGLTQSPEWDDIMPLVEMWKQAKFFILRKGDPHGDLVSVVLSSRDFHGQTVYDYRSLGHDRYGITCEAEGSIQANHIQELIHQGKAELTTEYTNAIRHIWEVMECHPNVERLFTEYETVL